MAEIKKEEGHLIRVVSYEERIHELEQDLEHKKIAIQNRNAKIEELEEQLRIATDYPEWSKVVKLSQEDCIKEVAELRKKNADLKADFLKACKVKEQGFREAEQALERKDDQLTKATKLLKHWANSYGGVDVFLCKQTQQFLNEVKK